VRFLPFITVTPVLTEYSSESSQSHSLTIASYGRWQFGALTITPLGKSMAWTRIVLYDSFA
jgi:hypothetical protein